MSGKIRISMQDILRECSGFDLHFAPPWLTHTHTHTAFERLYWLDQPAEVKTES